MLNDLMQELHDLKHKAYIAERDRSFKYGRIGVKNASGNWEIPSDEAGMKYITVTLEEGTLLKQVDSRGITTPGLEVRLVQLSGRYVIDGEDERGSSLTTTNASAAVPKHSHNIGYPSAFPIDPASINDGYVNVTGNGLNVAIGRVTYPKSDGTIGIYDASDTLDLASGVSGLTAITARWVVLYIDRDDGSANFHVSATETTPLNTTTHIENAIADCLTTVPSAFPFQVVKMTAGLAAFGTYKPMEGLSMSNKTFIRLGFGGAMGGASGAISADTLVLNDGSELTIATGAIAATTARHTIDTESDAASDDLNTINGLSAGEIAIISANHTDRTVVLKHAADNIVCSTGADISLDDTSKTVLLLGRASTVLAFPLFGSAGGGGIGGSTGATNNAVLRADGTGGATVQSSGVTIDDTDNVDIPGALTLGTVLAVAEGGTGAGTAVDARTALGLAIGTNVQAYDADLDDWAGKTAPTGAAVGTTDAQALTNKNLTDASNTFAVDGTEITSGVVAHERGGLEADVSAYAGVPLIRGGATSEIKYNLVATAAPTVNNDTTEGYVVGSRWYDVTADKEYVCLDNTDGAAVWIETTASGGGSGDTLSQFLVGNFTTGSNILSSSTGYVDISASIQQAATLSGGEKVVVRFDFKHMDATSTNTVTLKVVADNSGEVADDDTVEVAMAITGAYAESIEVIFTGLSSGTWTFKPQWKTTANNARIIAGAPVKWTVKVYS